jgi:hypothetical protein
MSDAHCSGGDCAGRRRASTASADSTQAALPLPRGADAGVGSDVAGRPVWWTPADAAATPPLADFVAPAVLAAARAGRLRIRACDALRQGSCPPPAAPRSRAPPPPRPGCAPPPLALARLAAAGMMRPRAVVAGAPAKHSSASAKPPRAARPAKRPRSPPPARKPTCSFYMQGRCLRGAACEFAHDAPPATRLLPCRFFARGACMKGPACEYSHDPAHAEPCRRLVLAGACGVAGCRFSHPELAAADLAALRELAERREAARADMGMKGTAGVGPRAPAAAPGTPPDAPDPSAVLPGLDAAAARAAVAAAAAASACAVPDAAGLLSGALAGRVV